MGQLKGRERRKLVRLWWAWANLVAIFACLFTVLVVNYWIYRARSEYYLLHSVEAAAQPPTISKAITDPAIGDPFQFWISLSALFLPIGVAGISMLYLRAAARLPVECRGTRLVLTVLAPLLLCCQVAAAMGMIMLSAYRGPDHDHGHMIGSYIFFGAQAAVVLCFGLMCLRIDWDAKAARSLGQHDLIRPALSRYRGPFAMAAVLSAVLYLVLYLIKGLDFQLGYAALYQAYVWIEPFTISCFLIVLASYCIDLAAAITAAGWPASKYPAP